MNSEELILGFDARVMPGESGPAWTQERMNIFLMRLDIVQPLSVDRIVWPSVPGANGPTNSGSWNGLDLWQDLQAFQTYLKEPEVSFASPYWIISISLLANALTVDEQNLWAPRLPLATLAIQFEAWSFLGYDIADLSLLSGLSNCSYKQEHIELARKRWTPHLNRFPLFDEQREAIEFKAFSDQRVPEHAQFFVYGIYRLKGI